ncbi:unnamed protein product, partial [Urochloa humidicola]
LAARCIESARQHKRLEAVDRGESNHIGKCGLWEWRPRGLGYGELLPSPSPSGPPWTAVRVSSYERAGEGRILGEVRRGGR